jgi:hypothetical protein
MYGVEARLRAASQCRGRCVPPGRAEIACLRNHEFHYLSMPTTCSFFARQYYPDGRLRRFRDVGTKHQQWTDWGKPVSIDVGKPEFAYPIRVVAFDRVRCPDGRWYYGKVFTHGSVGNDHHLGLARCGAKRFKSFSTATQKAERRIGRVPML